MSRLTVGIKVKGVREVAQNLGIAQNDIKRVAGEAMYDVGKQIIEEAKVQCPVDTGALRNSAILTPPVAEADGVLVTGGFGTGDVVNPKSGVATEQYAVPVHERLDVHHPTGKAKFLEDAAYAARDELEREVVKRVARLVGR